MGAFEDAASDIFSAMTDVDAHSSPTAVFSSGGVTSAVPCLVSRDVEGMPAGFDTYVTERRTMVEFLAADVPNPVPGDTVTVDGTVYTIYETDRRDGYVVRCLARAT